MSDCITLRLTSEQQDQLRRLTGRDGEALQIPVEMLDDFLLEQAELPPGDFEDMVWECLNPYP